MKNSSWFLCVPRRYFVLNLCCPRRQHRRKVSLSRAVSVSRRTYLTLRSGDLYSYSSDKIWDIYHTTVFNIVSPFQWCNTIHQHIYNICRYIESKKSSDRKSSINIIPVKLILINYIFNVCHCGFFFTKDNPGKNLFL